MNNKNKALLLVLCAVAIVTASIFGTLAYLTDTEAVTNTFTVGQVGLKLDEAVVNEDGTPVTPAARTEDGNKYHLLPGHTYTKDPTVTMDADSEDAYVRMIVEVENVDMLEAALNGLDQKYLVNLGGDDGKDPVLSEMLNGTWNAGKWPFIQYTEKTKIVGEGDETKTISCGYYEFRYKTVVAKGISALEPLFTEIKVPGEIDNIGIEKLADVKINVTAHAIQADGFDDAAEAWTAFGNQK